MPVDTQSLFSQVIQDHLELKEKNSELDQDLPLDRYKNDDPFENHPLFKTEEQARIEETMDGVQPDFEVFAHASEIPVPAWPGEDTAEHKLPEPEDSGLWSRSRDFDWGD